MKPLDMFSKFYPAGLTQCKVGHGQANTFVNKFQSDSCLSCGYIYQFARNKEIAYIQKTRADKKVTHDPFKAMEGSSAKYQYDYYVAMNLCPLAGYTSDDYVQVKDLYAYAHIVIIIVIVILVTIVCCGWYFCCRVQEVDDILADRDIRD